MSNKVVGQQWPTKINMGVCFQCIKDHTMIPTVEPRENLNLTHDWVWVAIRVDPELNEDGAHDWHLQGVAADEQIAIEMCVDENYLIGPLPINFSLPHEKIEWVGSYFPHAQ